MGKLVSVLMAVHNEAPEYLRASIESICRQTYRDIEFIIVDDASEEKCRKNLDSIVYSYHNIRVIHNECNLGLTRSLNIGLAAARGIYLARMDADDISHPQRIEKQVDYLEQHKDVDICGTGVITFGEDAFYMSPSNGFSSEEAKVALFFSSTLCHPSVMLRMDFLRENNLKYDETIGKAQDYDLWERCSHLCNMLVLKEVLLYYRIHEKQISILNKSEQDSIADKIRLRRLSYLGITPSPEEYNCHLLLTKGRNDTLSPKDVRCWIRKLLVANHDTMMADNNIFKKDLTIRYFLYKLRNGYYFRLCNPRDLFAFCFVVVSRAKTRILLKKAIREFRRVSNYE